MKRFYCTVCNKVKRVRRLPADVRKHPEAKPAFVGSCTRHANAQASRNR